MVGEMEIVGQLGNGAVGSLQAQGGFSCKRLVEETDNSAATHLSHDAREVGGGNAEPVGIELEVAVADVVAGYQA